MKDSLKILLSILIVFTLAIPVGAQEVEEGKDGENTSLGPRRQMATIIFAGLGGAVLGLSTLSFYGRPQDKLANIAIGAAVGIIVGVVFTAYSMASEPEEYYSEFTPEGDLFKNQKSFEVVKTDEVKVQLYEWQF